MPTGSSIRLQLLLRPEHRQPASIERAAAIATDLGLTVSARGFASVSATADPATYARLFQPPGSRGLLDPEALEGQTDPDPLPVPGPLSPYVESIAVAPRHLRF